MSDFINPLTDYSPQMETTEMGAEFGPGSESGVFTEDQELELASQFLEVADEQELHGFIDNLIGEAAHALNGSVEPEVEQDLGDILKGIAKVALPIAGGALGGFFGGPAGAALGGSLASAASKAFGLELEGLSPEDSEFEASKQFVKFAGAAVQNALEADPRADPRKVASAAAAEAARVHAPGVMNIASAGVGKKQTQTGRWIRHHGKVILLGV
jgi:hypothetical protein